MYPELFRIPIIDYSISTFGVMMAIAFLTGFWITRKGMVERGFDGELASSLLVYTMLGGVIGSKIYYTIDVGLRTGLPFSELLFARAGITWYGGLIGGTIAGIIGSHVNKLPKLPISACIAPALAVGQALGRVGCFLVGDDYGKVTDVAWAVTFPQGAPPTLDPVHPTQLYEIVWLLPVAALLWSRRHKSPFLFGEYMALNGIGRIVIEHWRVNPPIMGLTEPQWIGVMLIVAGGAGWIYQWRKQTGTVPA